ncbi:endocuticle structural glycoprotein SgAbd-2-like [Lutzomyia longipalpis]|uniref:endocuticle structural glycoprotein SgAbd-2-like n=1 Tax=Lutzomyia longipalpis TaxID=7200 RepID=UPI002483DECA|nr:endocuticle structural glycoprotein SgAbd-2-like [Lutzomyia longipalpis]
MKFLIALFAVIVVVAAKPRPQDYRTPDYYDYQPEPKVHQTEVQPAHFARTPEPYHGTYNYPTRAPTTEKVTRKPIIDVTHYNSESDDTHYSFSYETEDGQKRKEEGEVVNPGTEDESYVVRGSYSYVNDGLLYVVTYFADDTGFHPHVKKTPITHA